MEEIARIETAKERNAAYGRLTKKKLRPLAKPLPLGNGPKQAIVADALAQAKSYVELKRDNPDTSYPTTPKLNVEPEDYDRALDGLVNSQTILEENEYRDLLAKLDRPGIPRPLNILKNRVSDGALILKDAKDRLFAFINLLPEDAKHLRILRDARKNVGKKAAVDFTGFVDTRTGKFPDTKTTKCGDVFPLECGSWHFDKFMDKGKLQSSRLIFDGKEFFLACTFRFESPVREPERYLGVDRGIELLAAWSVVDEQGRCIDKGSIDGDPLRKVQRREERTQKETQRKGRIYRSKTRRAIADEEVHKAANKIVAAAVRHNARVVLEDLTTITMGPHHKRPKGGPKGGFRRMLTRAQYAKLKDHVAYRLALAGVPPVRRDKPAYIEVRPAYTSVTCSACGHQDKKSRRSQSEFRCTRCGYEDNADLNAAANVAAKGIHFDTVVRGRRKGQKLRDHEQFSAWYAALKSGAGRHYGAPWSSAPRPAGMAVCARLLVP